jgi:hypothetical protein
MQYVQRKLQRSVTEMRRSRTGRPRVSVGATLEGYGPAEARRARTGCSRRTRVLSQAHHRGAGEEEDEPERRRRTDAGVDPVEPVAGRRLRERRAARKPAIGAELAKQLGARRVAVLSPPGEDAYAGFAKNIRAAGRRLGLMVVALQYDPEVGDLAPFARSVARTRPDVEVVADIRSRSSAWSATRTARRACTRSSTGSFSPARRGSATPPPADAASRAAG